MITPGYEGRETHIRYSLDQYDWPCRIDVDQVSELFSASQPLRFQHGLTVIDS
jgi:hypothetical protein